MIEVLSDMPAGVTGIRVSGRVSGDDIREFEPTMDDLVVDGEIRIVEVIDPDYEGFGPGGLAADLKVGFGALFKHHSAFKRIAVVSDKPWVAHTLHAVAWMIPGELQISGSTNSTARRSGLPADRPADKTKLPPSAEGGRFVCWAQSWSACSLAQR